MTEAGQESLKRLKRNAYAGIAATAMLIGLTGCSVHKTINVNNPQQTTQKEDASVSATISPSQVIEGDTATITVTVTGTQGKDLSGGSIAYGNLGSAEVTQGSFNCTGNSGSSCTENDTITDSADESLPNIRVTYSGNSNYNQASTDMALDVLPTCTGAPVQGRTVNGTVLAIATSDNTLHLLSGINAGTPAANITGISVQLQNPGAGTQGLPYLTTDGKYIYTLVASSSSPTDITNENLEQISPQGQIVSTTPVIQPGQQNDGTEGYAKAGPNGVIYAVGTPEASTVTPFIPGGAGQFTQGGQIQFQEQLAGQHGLEFSPNQKCGYAAMLTANQNGAATIFSSGVATFDLKTGEVMDEGLPVGNMTSIAVNPNGKEIYGVINGFTTGSASDGIVNIDPSNPTKLVIRDALPLFGDPFNIVQPSLTSDGSTMIAAFSTIDLNSSAQGAAIQAFSTADGSNIWLQTSESPPGSQQEFVPLYSRVTPDNTKDLEIIYDTLNGQETLVVWKVSDGTMLTQVNLGYYNGINSAIDIEFGPDQSGGMNMAYINPENAANQVIGYNLATGMVTFGAGFTAPIISMTLP